MDVELLRKIILLSVIFLFDKIIVACDDIGRNRCRSRSNLLLFFNNRFCLLFRLFLFLLFFFLRLFLFRFFLLRFSLLNNWSRSVY